MTGEDCTMDPEPLTTYMGQPIEPHVVEWPEADRYYCGTCGHEVDCDGGDWTHKDERYQAW